MCAQRVTPERFCNAALYLGVSDKMVDYIAHAVTPQEAFERLKTFLPELKERWRKLAFATHPDRGGDKVAFVAVQDAWELVQDESFSQAIWLASRARPAVQSPAVPTTGVVNIPTRFGSVRIVLDPGMENGTVQFTSGKSRADTATILRLRHPIQTSGLSNGLRLCPGTISPKALCMNLGRR